MRSFQAIGTPSKGESIRPVCARSRAAFASAIALSRVTVRNTGEFCAAIRSSKTSVKDTGSSSRAAIARPISAAVLPTKAAGSFIAQLRDTRLRPDMPSLFGGKTPPVHAMHSAWGLVLSSLPERVSASARYVRPSRCRILMRRPKQSSCGRDATTDQPLHPVGHSDLRYSRGAPRGEHRGVHPSARRRARPDPPGRAM